MKKLKIKKLLLAVLLSSVIYSDAQTLSPKVTASGGGYATSIPASLSWTMGETNIKTLQTGSGILNQGFQQAELDIRTTTIGNSICVSSSLFVPYTATAPFNSGNIFTVQLSNATGSFASPTAIGTFAATQSGNISCTIPVNTPLGTGYRIRVVSSDPVITGTDNGSNISVNNCLYLKLFIEGYYLSGGFMQPAMFKELVSGATATMTDTIFVELHDAFTPSTIIATAPAILMEDGTATAAFNSSIVGNTYWIAIKHRNAMETWSAAPVTFGSTTNYDFTAAQSQAYGNNMVAKEGFWAFYSGNINQDGNIDLLDFPPLDYGINQGLFGYYETDLNGDGNIDLLDFPILQGNIANGIFYKHP